jgi:hypothetical protein
MIFLVKIGQLQTIWEEISSIQSLLGVEATLPLGLGEMGIIN